VPLRDQLFRQRRLPLVLALLGFVPFAVLTGALFVPDATLAQTAGLLVLKVYAAIILSFLGGIRWGIAVKAMDEDPDMSTFVLSVMPSLWAWAAFFVPGPSGFVMFAIGFAAMGLWDRALVARGGAPDWFGLLRIVLTWLVTPTMLVAAIASRSIAAVI